MSSNGWKEINLQQIAFLNYGKSLPADKRKGGLIPVYSSAGITGWHNEALVKDEGIIVGRKGTVGTVYYSDKPFCCIDTAYYVKKADLKCDIKYLYYLLKTLGLEKLNEDSAVPGLNRDTAHSQRFYYPESIETQRRIADILSALDEKIELNRQTNATLESIAQAIFKEWFVDFNFPGTTGEMIDVGGDRPLQGAPVTPTGMIPRGWRVGKLGEIIINYDSIRIPVSSRERENHKGIYPYYGAAAIFDYIDDYLFDGVYLLMGEDGTVITEDEKPVLQYVTGKFWVNNHAHVLTGKGSFSTEYVYLLLKNTNIKHIVTGAVQLKINQGNMNNLPVIIPDEKTLLNFQNIVKPLLDNILENEQQTISLAAIRDALLPKLMNGEIDV